MRVLIAGATGAIGRPLIQCLCQNRHTVYALARSTKSSRLVTELGAEPVTADALDAASVKAAIIQLRPDAVINQLTSLPSHYTAAEMRAAAERDRKVRIEGNFNLLAALRDARVRRYVLQSGGFWYAPGDGLADESVSFAFDASPAVAAGGQNDSRANQLSFIGGAREAGFVSDQRKGQDIWRLWCSHSSGRGRKLSSRFAFSFEAPRSRVA